MCLINQRYKDSTKILKHKFFQKMLIFSYFIDLQRI